MSRLYGVRPHGITATITPMSRCAIPEALRLSGAGTPVTGVSPWSDAADSIICFPFTLDVATPVYKVFWVNGSSVNAGTTFDVAIYDEDYNFIASTGAATAQGSASVPQVVALSATVTLPPGRYYAGMSCSVTTTNRVIRWSIGTIGISHWMAAGCFKTAADTPPIAASSITPIDLTNVAFPVFGLITRSVFDV